MPSPPAVYAALSVHSFVTKVGDYAGFLAIIGVALLVIMYFVHARETANLRDRTEDAEDRMAHLEYQLEQVSRTATAAHQTAQAAGTAVPAPPVTAPAVGRPATVPAPAMAAQAGAPVVAAPATATAAVSRPAARTIPEAPFGTAAPALSAATRMIPGPVEQDVASSDAQASPAQAAPAPAAQVAPAQPAAASPQAAPAPVTAIAAAPAPATPEPASPPPATVAASGGASEPPPRIPTAPRRDYGRDSGSRSRRGWIAAAAMVVVAVIVVAVVLVIHNHDSSSSSSSSRTAASTHASGKKKSGKSTTTSKRVDPTNVTVAVLNGTTTDNLAADVSQKLSQEGFKPGMTANAPDHEETTTVVGYLPGDRTPALAVAKALDLQPNAVHAVTSPDRQAACASTPTTCPAQVVVTVGADLASIA